MPALLTSASTGSPKASSSGVEQPIGRCGVGDVALDRDRAAAGLLDRAPRPRRPRRRRAVVDADGPSVLGEPAGDRRADPARAAGDERASRSLAAPHSITPAAPREAGAERAEQHARAGRQPPVELGARERHRQRRRRRSCRASRCSRRRARVGSSEPLAHRARDPRVRLVVHEQVDLLERQPRPLERLERRPRSSG